MTTAQQIARLVQELDYGAKAQERIAVRHADNGDAGHLARQLRDAIALLEEYRELLVAGAL